LLPRCILATATSIPGHRGMTTQKVSIFFYSLPQKSERSAINRFHAKLVKYSNFYDIFADVSPILMKFCMIAHSSYPEHKSCSKVKFKKRSRYWTLLFKKKLSNAIYQLLFHWFWWSLLPRCILATATSIPGQCIHRGMTMQKVSIFFYSLPQYSERSANNRFHAKLVKNANFYDIFADVWPILMKFCMMAHISYPEHKSCSKVKFKKKPDGSRCCLKKLSDAICQLLFHWFW